MQTLLHAHTVASDSFLLAYTSYLPSSMIPSYKLDSNKWQQQHKSSSSSQLYMLEMKATNYSLKQFFLPSIFLGSLSPKPQNLKKKLVGKNPIFLARQYEEGISGNRADSISDCRDVFVRVRRTAQQKENMIIAHSHTKNQKLITRALTTRYHYRNEKKGFDEERTNFETFSHSRFFLQSNISN